MTHASIFSGIGGAELAASWMGWQNLFHCEIQAFPRKVLEYWYPNSISYDDIKKTDFREWKDKVDVLTAGFPCQPFSVAGKRAGADDNRYLWPETIRAIREIQPAWVVGENVAGIISMVQPGDEVKMGCTDDLFEKNYIYRNEQEYTLSVICKDLERAEYAVQPFVIPACAVGAPHRRDRVWIVAYANDSRVEGTRRKGQDETNVSNVATHSDSIGQQRRRSEGNGIEGDKTKWDDLFIGSEGSGGKSAAPNSYSPRGWRNFPTQSPICSRNDGLPFDVADLAISFPKWRQEAIKALGNAWVPQVAYEIFKAIEQLENIKNR